MSPTARDLAPVQALRRIEAAEELLARAGASKALPSVYDLIDRAGRQLGAAKAILAVALPTPPLPGAPQTPML